VLPNRNSQCQYSARSSELLPPHARRPLFHHKAFKHQYQPKHMRNLHDDGNTLLHHKISKRDMNTTKGPVDSAPASDDSQPDTPVAKISIPRKENKMSIGFVIDAEVKTTKPISAPVRHTALQPQQHNSNVAVIKTTLHGHYGIYTECYPSHPSQSTSTQPVFYRQPANEYPKRDKPTLSGSKYSEEEDSFIVDCYLVKKMSWSQVEHEFKSQFGHRTKRGLTCHYSEICRKRGLSKARSNPTDREKDKGMRF
jgi:hypothetical protein